MDSIPNSFLWYHTGVHTPTTTSRK